MLSLTYNRYFPHVHFDLYKWDHWSLLSKIYFQENSHQFLFLKTSINLTFYLHSVWELQTYSFLNRYLSVELQAYLSPFTNYFQMVDVIRLRFTFCISIKSIKFSAGLLKIHCHWDTFKKSRIKLLERMLVPLLIKWRVDLFKCCGLILFLWSM